MNKNKIEQLTRTALDFIEKSNQNDVLAETDKSMTPIYASQENWNGFLATFGKLQTAVIIQEKIDEWTSLRYHAHFEMKRHQYAENLLEYARYKSEVDLYDAKIEELKKK